MLEETTHSNGVTEPWWTGSEMAPQSKKSHPKPGDFLALKWHREAWSRYGAKPKNHYESYSYNATELKRRAANYSDCLPGLVTDPALVGAAHGHQRDWRWFGCWVTPQLSV